MPKRSKPLIDKPTPQTKRTSGKCLACGGSGKASDGSTCPCRVYALEKSSVASQR